MASATTLLLGVGLAPILTTAPAATAAPVGQGFHLNASDIRFIFRQIQISERHAVTASTANPCGTLVGPGADQIPDVGNSRELPWGLRTVDGSCNNLIPGGERWGAADVKFPRLVDATPHPGYGTGGAVTDPEPRRISNLIADQSPNNPAAVAAAGTDQPAPGDGNTLFIENVAPDVGLSAPYNSWFTLFGQFFDHGLDLVSKGGNGVVTMPLAADDPLVVDGPDGTPGTGDEVPAGTPMMLTRATNVGSGGSNEAENTTTSYVDQNQTYASHPSHQVFLREYELLNPTTGAACTPAGPDCRPVDTGRLLTGPGGGMATWADVKAQARTKLGINLRDADALSVPILVTDAYGHFVRGSNGFPQIMKSGGPVQGDPAAPVNTDGAARTKHAFLADIAHHAIPRQGYGPDADSVLSPNILQCRGPNTPTGCVNAYDDEMLAAHFMAGDGRVNENIGLTAVHHIFHSEHNRLREDLDSLINDPSTGLTAQERNGWRAVGPQSGWGYGERLFQAARYVTEMEYQHLVFEEFARKVQPMVNEFGEGGTGYNTEVNAAIRAEFAHAVYRFGHSMLTEHVTRTKANGDDDSKKLLEAFLNPPMFMQGYGTPEAAAGSIVRGMTRQPGNEIDEFVTEALRNNLLGLPLDLASINLARARDTGIPKLNAARRSFYAASASTQVMPYESWTDFAFNLRNRESLVNFVAAYGTHDTITGGLEARRTAAARLVYGAEGPDGVLHDVAGTPENEEADNLTDIPADRLAFMNGTVREGTEPNRWVSGANGVTTTGVDAIDLWMGGLAEKRMVFGGMLGSTLNYVFERQMEDLQEGDRFYYLSRTAGLNLLTQLEGNSFAELTMRNTDAEGLPADPFSYPTYVFDVDAIDNDPGTVQDDPATEWREDLLLTRMANGSIRYGGVEHVVFNGDDTPDSPGAGTADKIRSSEGDDTVRGNDGDDWVEGGDGNDNLIGGHGDDTLLDQNGDDNIKGGDDDDVISSGTGAGGDLNQGGRGKDYIVGGNDITESFGGPGDDFIFAGAAADTVFGDDDDDWIEGGRGPFNLLQGDNGAPFANDLNLAGHDVLIGYGGEQDYDAEGGDDIMLAGPGIQRNEGMRGFDWVTHQGDPVAADSDMRLTGLLPPSVETNRDRFDLVEGLSGWDKNDVLRGDDRVAADFTIGAESHVLTGAGINRITGLAGLMDGAQSFTGGNILLGGGGADTLEGRGGDDVIDGDAQLEVFLRVPDLSTSSTTDTKLVTNMAAINADVIAGRIKPGDITVVKRIVTVAGADDRALFSGPRNEYTISPRDDDGWQTVAHTGGTGLDGTDRIRNVEQLVFGVGTPPTDTPDVPDAPTLTAATAAAGSATVTFAQGADGGSPVTEFRVRVFEDGATVPFRVVSGFPGTATSATVTGLIPGVPVSFTVVSVNAIGVSQQSAMSRPVTPSATPPPGTGGTPPPPTGGGGATPPPTTTPPPAGAGSALSAPDMPTILKAKSGKRGGKTTAIAKWRPPTVDGGSEVTGYRVYAYKLRPDGKVRKVIRSKFVDADRRRLVMRLPAGLYRFRVVAINDIGKGKRSALSNTVASR